MVYISERWELWLRCTFPVLVWAGSIEDCFRSRGRERGWKSEPWKQMTSGIKCLQLNPFGAGQPGD